MTQTDRLRVLMLLAPGPFGGAERVVVAGANALAARDDVSVTLCLIRELRAPELADNVQALLSPAVNVVVLGSKGRVDLGLLRQLRHLAKPGVFDVVHSHGYKAGLAYMLGRKRCEKTRWVMTHHGVTAHTRTVQIYETLERLCMRRADHVMAVSQMMQQQLSHHKIGGNKVSVVKNMLGTNVSSTPSADQTSKRAVPSILFLGRLSHEKGLDLLVKTVRSNPKLSDARVVQFDILGDGPAREMLPEDLPSSIQFYGFQDDPQPYLATASAMVVPSRTEGMPLSVIEALAQGLPVIGFDVGGMAELVQQNKNGVLVQAGDCDALADALLAHLNEPQKLGAAARGLASYYQAEFSPDRWANDVMAVYQSVALHGYEVSDGR